MSAMDSLKEGGVRVRRWQNLTAGRSKGRTVGRRHEYVITSVRKKSITGLEGTGETGRGRSSSVAAAPALRIALRAGEKGVLL